MKKAVCYSLLGLLLGLCFSKGGSQAAEAPQSHDKVETVASVQDPDFSGVVVTKEGRIFLGFPRHAVDHKGPTLAEYKDGRLIPFPNKEMTYLSTAPWSEQLVSPHGMTLDAEGRLWLIDDGKRAGIKEIPDGAAKVVGIDVKSGRIFRTVVIKAPALLPDSHLNDLRIDLTHGTEGMAYITDSSFGTRSALVVVDLAKASARRVLAQDASTQAVPGFSVFLEGKPHVYDAEHPTFPIGGADGIALSPDSKRVYWTQISGRRLYSLPSASLSDPRITDEDLSKAIRDEGERPACDGIDSDSKGNLYFGAFEHQSVIRRTPKGELEVLAHDSRFVWPDALFVSGKFLYVSLGQWNRLAGFNGGKDLRKPPYQLVRIPID